MENKYEIPDIPDLIYKEKEKKIKRYPCHTNRASGLGYAVPELQGCLRRGVYERTHWEEKELHDGRLQAIFDEGNNQERTIVKDMLEAGIEIIEAQRSYSWPEYQISGHIDGKILATDEKGQSVAIPCEIKSMAPHIFDSVKTFDDFKSRPHLRSYIIQITLYMLMQNIDRAIFILKNKSNGALKQIEVSLDYEIGEAAIKAAEQINRHVAAKTLPDKVEDIEICKNCSFKLICHPDRDFGVPLKIADDPLFEKRLDEYKEGEEQSKAIAKMYNDEIKTKIKATANDSDLNMVVGKYHITAKKDKRGYLRIKIDLVGVAD